MVTQLPYFFHIELNTNKLLTLAIIDGGSKGFLSQGVIEQDLYQHLEFSLPGFAEFAARMGYALYKLLLDPCCSVPA